MAHHTEGPKPSLHLVGAQANDNNNNNDSKKNAHVVSFDNTKAGLQKVDKKQVEEVIENLSKGSNFYNNKKRKRDMRQKKIDELLHKEKVEYQRNVVQNPLRYKATCAEVTKIEAELMEQTPYRDIEVFNQQGGASQLVEGESGTTQSTPPDLVRIFVHIDMDMFYAAVEEKKDPQLKNVPFAVGGMSMLSTSNYIARQYGVRSGMPGFIAKRLCPELKIIPTDFKSYQQESTVFQDVCRQYDEHLISIGWDELTMEIGPFVYAEMQRERLETKEAQHKDEQENPLSRVEQYFLKGAAVVDRIRAEVRTKTGMTCSAGIGISPTFAKFASNVNKPNGQLLLPLYTHEAVMDFLRGTSVREIPGIGESTEYLLHGLGIRTMGDVYREKLKLFVLFTRKTFLFLFGASLGVCGMFDFYSRHQDKKSKKKKKKKEKQKRKKQKKEEGEAASENGSSNEDSNSDSSSTSGSSDTDGDPSREHSRSGGGGPPDQRRAYHRIFHSFSRKSVGHEHTFHNLKSRLELEDIALRCLRDSMETIQRKQLLCGHLVVKLKHVSFEVKQYSRLVLPFPGMLAAATTTATVKTEPPPPPPQPAAPTPTLVAPSLAEEEEEKKEEAPSELVYEFENKYYTDQYELLKYNLYALLSPVVEQYAQYRLLGVRLEKLVSKVHLCAYQKWFANSPMEGGLPNQKTLQYFFQQKKTDPPRHKGELKANKEPLYYNILSESEEDNVVDASSSSSSSSSGSESSSSSMPPSALPEAMGEELGEAEQYMVVSSSSQLSRSGAPTLEHFFKSQTAQQRKKAQENISNSREDNKKEEEEKHGDADNDDDDDVVIIE